MDWQDERYAILYQTPEHPFSASEVADADKLLMSCQLAIRHPPESLTRFDRAIPYDGALMERLALAVMAAPIDLLRKATLHGALRMHQAHLWSRDWDEDPDEAVSQSEGARCGAEMPCHKLPTIAESSGPGSFSGQESRPG